MYVVLGLPLWAAVLLPVVLLVGGLVAVGARRAAPGQRFASRAHDGLCLVCGYDLRESPDRCPECGGKVQEWVYGAVGSRSTRERRGKLRR